MTYNRLYVHLKVLLKWKSDKQLNWMCDTFTITIYYHNNTKIIEYIVLLYSLFHKLFSSM